MRDIIPFRSVPALAIAVLLSVSNSFGQWEVGAFAGGGIGMIRTELHPIVSRGESESIEQRPSWSLGSTARHNLSGPVGFSTGVTWSNIAGHDEYWVRGAKISESDRVVQYLYVPIVVDVEWRRFRMGLGYQLGYLVGQSGTFSSFYAVYGGTDQTNMTHELGLMKTDMGILGLAGYQLSERFDIGARVHYGLMDIKDHSDGWLNALMTTQALFTIGFRILPGRKAGVEEPETPTPVEQPSD